LGRHTIEALTTFEELTALGVNIVAVADGIDTSTKNGKMPYFFKSMMNELFSTIFGEGPRDRQDRC